MVARETQTCAHDEPCLICKRLKDFQSDRMYTLNQQAVRHLCNLHTWLLAKTAEASIAAEVLLRILDCGVEEELTGTDCRICELIAEEEDRRLRDFAQSLSKPEPLLRFRQRGGLCIPHAQKLFDRVPKSLRMEIVSALKARIVELRGELATLSRNAKAGETIHPGLLGRAAEFLAANRGFYIARK